ncbi:MAG TPA: hypothetical protein VGF22_09310 [Acidimicrobiales bacterium]
MRLVMAIGIGIGAVVVTAAPAAADPARPTNVSSHVIAISPPTPAVAAEIVGGNAFLRIHVRPGTTVLVHGYEDEPYLRISADGTVAENTRSAATYLNRTISGHVDIPPTVDKDAPPDWRTVGGGGSYAWHDHRVHWMASGGPPQAVDWKVALDVDGAPASIDGRYMGVTAPSAVPWWLLAVVAVGAVVLLGRSHPRVVAVGVLVAAGLGLPVALAAARLPASGIGDWTGVALLGVAAVAAVAAILSRAGPWLAGAGVALVVWSFRRLDVLDHAVLVTDLPGWLDRAAVALALGVGVGAVVVGVRLVARTPVRQPA